MSVRRFDGFRWEDVSLLAYKEGGPYKGVTRQVLFEGEASLPAQWRYFEVEPGGHSTLERHEHLHYVLILRGRGRCLVGETVTEIKGWMESLRSPFRTAEAFYAEEIIDPRDTRPLLCEWAGLAQRVLERGQSQWGMRP